MKKGLKISLIISVGMILIAALATGGYFLYKYIQIRNKTENVNNTNIKNDSNTEGSVIVDQPKESDIPNVISDDSEYKNIIKIYDARVSGNIDAYKDLVFSSPEYSVEFDDGLDYDRQKDSSYYEKNGWTKSLVGSRYKVISYPIKSSLNNPIVVEIINPKNKYQYEGVFVKYEYETDTDGYPNYDNPTKFLGIEVMPYTSKEVFIVNNIPYLLYAKYFQGDQEIYLASKDFSRGCSGLSDGLCDVAYKEDSKTPMRLIIPTRTENSWWSAWGFVRINNDNSADAFASVGDGGQYNRWITNIDLNTGKIIEIRRLDQGVGGVYQNSRINSYCSLENGGDGLTFTKTSKTTGISYRLIALSCGKYFFYINSNNEISWYKTTNKRTCTVDYDIKNDNLSKSIALNVCGTRREIKMTKVK